MIGEKGANELCMKIYLERSRNVLMNFYGNDNLPLKEIVLEKIDEIISLVDSEMKKITMN